uniref:Uncharacterized protein n=1 Tax=Oryza nivara TaxID=4536 RepID=A0A0E0HZW5_ORYNI
MGEMNWVSRKIHLYNVTMGLYMLDWWERCLFSILFHLTPYYIMVLILLWFICFNGSRFASDVFESPSFAITVGSWQSETLLNIKIVDVLELVVNELEYFSLDQKSTISLSEVAAVQFTAKCSQTHDFTVIVKSMSTWFDNAIQGTKVDPPFKLLNN